MVHSSHMKGCKAGKVDCGPIIMLTICLGFRKDVVQPNIFPVSNFFYNLNMVTEKITISNVACW